MTCRDLLDPAESKGSASRTWSLISSWKRRGRGAKCLGVLGNDGNADKIEKSRRGNGLDGKRRGPAVSVLSNTFQEDFSFSWNCHSLRNRGLSFRRRPWTRGWLVQWY